jgi:hypothetical protein
MSLVIIISRAIITDDLDDLHSGIGTKEKEEHLKMIKRNKLLL